MHIAANCVFYYLLQTKGVPTVSDLIHIPMNQKTDEATEDYILWVLGSLERTSEHPLAKAIVKYAEDRLADVLETNPFVHPTDFQTITGRGASGIVGGNVEVAAGNRSFAAIMGLLISEEVDICMQRLEEVGKTAIIVALNGTVCLVLAIGDDVKDDAAASIAYLRDAMSIDVWMVTGDNTRTAAAISQKVGISPDRVIAEALPATKLEKVRALQADGRNIVCMVGDGINDSAALAQADVGIGMGAGADIATEASDMILVKGHVADVCTALHLSRALFRRIQWNLTLSLIYNCLGIPVAVGVFYPIVHLRLPPTLAAVAMALSSISVVLSSLTLRCYRPPDVHDRRRPVLLPRTSNNDDLHDMRLALLPNDHLADHGNST
jgi:P-type Cu+ transporter